MGRPSEALIDRVRELCETLMSDVRYAPLHDALQARLAELSEPLRLAVAGHVSAGKSTMVNALIGRQVAATGQAETTLVNAWFVYGRDERVIFARTGGGVVEVPLPPAGTTLPVPEDLDHDAPKPVTVVLDEALLQEITVIDTPGLFSPNSENSERTDVLIANRTRSAATTANALIYLTQEVPGSGVEDSQLRSFHSLFGGEAGKAPVNAVLVLSKIDLKWKASREDTVSPFEVAGELVRAHGHELWKRVWTTTPLIGHLAELGQAGARLSAEQLADLEVLAAYPHRQRLLESVGSFERAGVPTVRGAALLRRLGPYGLARSLDLLARGCPPGQLVEALRNESGLPELMAVITEVFRSRADLLRAETVLNAIKRDAARGDGTRAAAAQVRVSIERIIISDAGQDLRRLHALRLVCEEDNRELTMKRQLRLELRRLFTDGSRAERLGKPAETPLQALAYEANRNWERWRAVENTTLSPVRRQIAEIAGEAYSELTRDLERTMLTARP